MRSKILAWTSEVSNPLSGAEVVGQLQSASPVQDSKHPLRLLDERPRRALRLHRDHVGVVAVQGRKPLVRKSDADVVGRVLDGERKLGLVGDVAEERMYSDSGMLRTGGGCRMAQSAPASAAARTNSV